MNKHLRIVRTTSTYGHPDHKDNQIQVLIGLAQAEATMHAAGVKSAMPHFIAIVKELETILGFTFEKVDLDE
jgi:hypothetical protein